MARLFIWEKVQLNTFCMQKNTCTKIINLQRSELASKHMMKAITLILSNLINMKTKNWGLVKILNRKN